MPERGFHNLPEERLIQLLRANQKRHPRQLNGLFESDAELVELDDRNLLACTTDTLHEEITLGILRDPWKIGWTAVSINLSDLAAVAANPIGLLLAWTVPASISENVLGTISKGVCDSIEFHKTYLLGGDVNAGNELQLCGTALGLVPKKLCRQRTGMRPNQRIFMTGAIGLGNALGVARLSGLDAGEKLEELYRPVARLDAIPLIREFASACIDTSDGLLAALDTLCRLGGAGAEFHHRPEVYPSEVRRLARELNIPLWLFAVAEHGEFELLFTVEENRSEDCMNESRRMKIGIQEIGRTVASHGIMVNTVNGQTMVDAAYLRGLTSLVNSNPGEYIKALTEYSYSIGMKE